jgi:hypothetical protein
MIWRLCRKLESAGVDVAFVPATLYHSQNQQSMVVGSSEYQPGEHDTFVQVAPPHVPVNRSCNVPEGKCVECFETEAGAANALFS